MKSFIVKTTIILICITFLSSCTTDSDIALLESQLDSDSVVIDSTGITEIDSTGITEIDVINNINQKEFNEPAVIGNTFYIDPVNGLDNGDGSENNPWRTLEQVITSGKIQNYRLSEYQNVESSLIIEHENAPVKGGDQLLLKSGYHGAININSFYFNEWLTIAAAPGETPIMAKFNLQGLYNKVYLKNLNFILDSYQGEENYWEPYIPAILYAGSSNFFGNGSNLKVYGCTIKTSEDVTNWTRDDWDEKTKDGISIRSVSNTEVYNTNVQNVRGGFYIGYYSNDTDFVNSSIKQFCKDAFNVTGNNILIENNTIQGTVNINLDDDPYTSHHYDLIQLYSRGSDDTANFGVLENITIRGNKLINDDEFNYSFLSNLPAQGIQSGGLIKNVVIENNLIATSMWIGIELRGYENTMVLNNTVVDQRPDDSYSPRISIRDNYGREESKNVMVANNIVANQILLEGQNVTEQNNYIIGIDNYQLMSELFIDTAQLDYQLNDNLSTIENLLDKGFFFENSISSGFDIDGKPRLELPDIGAYELR